MRRILVLLALTPAMFLPVAAQSGLTADLSVTKTGPVNTVDAGAPMTYIIRLDNFGPHEATNVVVTDTLPAGVVFQSVSASVPGWSCGHSSGRVRCTRPSVDPLVGITINITVTAPVSAGNITNIVDVESSSDDPVFSNNSAAAVTTIASASADLRIDKADVPDPVNIGSSFTYRLTVSNLGPRTAWTVTVKDRVPPGVVLFGATGTGWVCNEFQQDVTCTRSSLTVGTASPINISAVAPATPGTLSNTATVETSTPDPDLSNNTSTQETTIVTPMADLSIVKTDVADPVHAGAVLVYSLTVANAGPTGSTQITVTDPLPAGVTLTSRSGSGWTCTDANRVVTCTRGGLAAGTAAPPINIAMTAPLTGGTITNTATVTAASPDPDPANNTDTEETFIDPQPASADLSVTKTDSPDPVVVGAALSWSVEVVNHGPTVADNVVVSDVLPVNAGFSGGSGSGWGCGFNSQTRTVTCSRSSLAVGPAPVLTISAAAPVNAGTATNTVSVGSITPDPVTGNNNDVEETTVITVPPTADLSIGKNDQPDPVTGGASLSYRLDVVNAGPAAAQSVVVTDVLPAGVTFASASGADWSCQHSSGVVTCLRATAVIGANAPIIISVATPVSGTSTLTNTATVSSSTEDPVPANNSDTVTTSVTPPLLLADLSVSLTDSPDPVDAGTPVTYTIEVTNAGPDPAVPVTLVDELSAGVSILTATGPDWSCVAGNGVASCSKASLAVGATSTVTVTALAPSGSGTMTSSVNVFSSGVPDANLSNNAVTEQTTVLPGSITADLSVSKSDQPDPVSPSSPITYRIGVTNFGPGAATAVVVTDTLPAGVVYRSASGSGWLCDHASGSVVCTAPELLPGAAPQITVVVSAPATPGPIVNTAAISSAIPDPVSANDTVSQTTTVSPPPPTADLSITLQDNPDPVSAGSLLEYVIQVTNLGPVTAEQVVVTDPLPSGELLISAQGVDWSCGQSSGTVICTLPSLSVGSAFPIVLTVTAPGNGGWRINTATVSSATVDPNTSNNTVSLSTTINAPARRADLVLAKLDAPDPVITGDTLTWTLEVTNNGPNGAEALVLTDTLPAGTTLAGASGDGWACAADAALITCRRLGLKEGATSRVRISATATAPPGAITNTAMVRSRTPDPNVTNNVAGQQTSIGPPPSADVTLQMSDAPDPAPAASAVSWELTVSNAGPDACGPLTLTDELPAGAGLLHAGGAGWGCGLDGSLVTCVHEGLAAGQAAGPLAIRVMTPGAPGEMLNTATVTSFTPDPDLAGNTVTESTQLDPSPPAANLAVRHGATPEAATIGSETEWVLSVANTGPDAAGGVVVTHSLGPHLEYLDAEPAPDGGGPDPSGLLTFSLPDLAAGDGTVIRIRARCASSSSAPDTASAMSALFEPDAADNSSGITLLCVDRLAAARLTPRDLGPRMSAERIVMTLDLLAGTVQDGSVRLTRVNGSPVDPPVAATHDPLTPGQLLLDVDDTRRAIQSALAVCTDNAGIPLRLQIEGLTLAGETFAATGEATFTMTPSCAGPGPCLSLRPRRLGRPGTADPVAVIGWCGGAIDPHSLTLTAVNGLPAAPVAGTDDGSHRNRFILPRADLNRSVGKAVGACQPGTLVPVTLTFRALSTTAQLLTMQQRATFICQDE